jgi:hypothetical protein
MIKGLISLQASALRSSNNSLRVLSRKIFDSSGCPAPGTPFHLAIPVHSVDEARKFYSGVLGLPEGRRAQDKWQDYSFNGWCISLQLIILF